MSESPEDAVLEEILKHEGGYQNDRADRANKNSKGDWVGTNLGITPGVYEETFGKVPTAQDMKRLTVDQAKEIYRDQYIRPVVDNLGIPPESPIFRQVVDMSVNHGYRNTVVMLSGPQGRR